MTFCWSNPLFQYLLEKVETFPEVTFTETELRKVSSEEFESLLKTKLLKYQQSDPEQETFRCPTPCGKVCDRVIGKIGENYQAICPGYSSVSPILLTKEDLNKYTFDTHKLLKEIKQKNLLVGSSEQISERLFFIGERYIGQQRIAVMLGLIGNERQAEILLGFSSKVRSYYRTLILLPFYDHVHQNSLASLEDQNIIIARFEEAFPKCDFNIDFGLLLKTRKRKVGVEYPQTTSAQERDYQEFGYRCFDQIHITGVIPIKRSNMIVVNGNEMNIGDYIFILLLRFIVELKKKKGGWVNIYTLYSEGIINDPLKYQIYSNLRSALAGSLLDKDGERFIQSNKSKSYRISTHPDFITYDKKELLKHPDHRIRQVAKKLR